MSDAATIITTGFALAGLVLYLFRQLRQDNQVLRQEVRQDIHSVRGEAQSVREEVQFLRQDLRETETRLDSRIDGVNASIDSLISLFNRPGSAA